MEYISIQDYLCSQDSVKGNECLYHYTSLDSFLSIMDGIRKDGNGAELLCTNFHFLNDDEEFKAGLEQALNWMEKNLEWIGCMTNVDVQDIQKLLDNQLRKEKQDYQWLSVPWVLSLSVLADSTAQWMAYSDRDKGGVAIGLSKSKLLELVMAADGRMNEGMTRSCGFQSDGGVEGTGGVFLAPCLYYDKSTKYYESYYDRLRHVFSTDESFFYLKKKNRRAYLWKCARQIIKQASLLKRKDYKFEREWRVVYAPNCKEILKGVRFIGGKPRLPLFGEAARNLVREIVVSHHGDSDRITRIAELLREKYQLKFKIIQSKSSFVG